MNNYNVQLNDLLIPTASYVKILKVKTIWSFQFKNCVTNNYIHRFMSDSQRLGYNFPNAYTVHSNLQEKQLH